MSTASSIASPNGHPSPRLNRGAKALSEEQLVQQARNVGFVIDHDPEMIEVFRRMMLYARTPLIILLRGETGTGKEPAARAIHALSQDGGHFVSINCAGVPDSLVESELFGHARGAFTDATNQRQGKFEHAQGGTLFLDEVGDATLPQQAKYLRILDERVLSPVGSNAVVNVADVKIVAGTNQPLEELVDQGRFRADLYHRLDQATIDLPPLGERTIDHRRALVRYLTATIPKTPTNPRISDDAVEALVSQTRPGNVRALRDHLHRAYWLAWEQSDLPVIQLPEIEAAARKRRSARAPVISLPIQEGVPEHRQELAGGQGEYLDGNLTVDFPPNGRGTMEFRVSVPTTIQHGALMDAIAALVVRENVLVDGNQAETARRMNMSRTYIRTKIEEVSALDNRPMLVPLERRKRRRRTK